MKRILSWIPVIILLIAGFAFGWMLLESDAPISRLSPDSHASEATGHEESSSSITALQLKIEEAYSLFDEATAKFNDGNIKGALDDALSARDLYDDDKEFTNLILNCRDVLISEVRQKFYTKIDDMDEITFVYAQQPSWIKPEDFACKSYACYAYTAERTTGSRLWLVLGFYARDWIFAESIKIKGGENSIEINAPPYEWSRDIHSGEISEMLVVSLDTLQLQELKLALQAEPIQVRFYGNKGNLDIVLSNEQTVDILAVLDYYELARTQ